MNYEETYDKFHKRCKDITGNEWCPYPNIWFMEIVFKVDDETAKRLIEKRRTFLFPAFLVGEPMYDELMEIEKQWTQN